MSAVMIVTMTITDPAWMEAYFTPVPALLRERGAVTTAAGRTISLVEGAGPPPDRVVIFIFPSLAAIDAFLADPRYRPFAEARRGGSRADIVVFENEARPNTFV